MTTVLGTRSATARSAWLATGVAALSAAAFVVLAVLVGSRWAPLLAFDQGVANPTHQALRHSHDTVGAARTVADLFDPDHVTIAVGVLAVVLLLARRVRAAIYLVVARGAELVAETATKNVVARARPDLRHPFSSPDGFSFPSGHTGGTAVLVVSLLILLAPLLAGRVRVVVVALAASAVLAVATARVLLGAHYPLDVLGGALLGVAAATAAAPILPTRPARDTRA